MSAPISRARSMLEMILAVLPAKSPTVGLICASAIRMVVISICHFNRVNNPDNRRVNRPVFQPVGHARAAARHDQHLLTKARADCVDSHKVAALVLAGERDRADKQKLFAFEARVFARRHYVADDASDDHSDWGVGNGEWGRIAGRISFFPTPYSLLPLLLYFPPLNWSATGRFSSTDECGRGMTCTLTSSPTRRAAAAPASVAALTAATSPRTIAVTNPPPIFS